MNNRGHMVLALIALLLFTVAGLGMLGQTLQHSRIERARRLRHLRGTQLRRALTVGLHEYRLQLARVDIAALADPVRDLFTAAVFPERLTDDCRLQHDFAFAVHRVEKDFRRTRVHCTLQAAIPGTAFGEAGEMSCDLLEGAIPLEELPLRVAAAGPGEIEEYLRRNGVVNRSGERAVGSEVGVVDNGDAWLGQAMQLDGTAVDWPALRRRLGMEPLDQPVPHGIYVIVDGREVSCVFVQGDVDRLTLKAGGDQQLLQLEQGGTAMVDAAYTPGSAGFSAPGTELAGAGLTFRERILVNGSIRRLEGDPAGAFTAATRLLIAVAGSVTIATPLQEENATSETVHLTLLTRNREFFSQRPVEADVTVTGGDGTRLQASLLVAGTLRLPDGQTTVTGSLQAEAIVNPGVLEVDGAGGGAPGGRFLVTTPYRFLDNFTAQLPLELGDE